MNRLIFAFLCGVACAAAPAYGQSEAPYGEVTGTVTDSASVAVEGAAVCILNNFDEAAILAYVLTDADGRFRIEAADSLTCLSVMAMGYEEARREVRSPAAGSVLDIGSIALASNPEELQQVVVNGERMWQRMTPDGYTIDVTQLALNSNNALDLLGRLPRVIVRDKKIKVLGKEKVLVKINNVVQRVSGEQLAEVLLGLDATLLTRVDVVTAPPLRYDPDGDTAMLVLHMSNRFARYVGGSLGTEEIKGAAYNGRFGGYLRGMMNYKDLYIDLGGAANRTVSYYRENRTLEFADGLAYDVTSPSRSGTNTYHGDLTVQYQYSPKGFVGAYVDFTGRYTRQHEDEHTFFPSATNLDHTYKRDAEPQFYVSAYAEHKFSGRFTGWLEGTFYDFSDNSARTLESFADGAAEFYRDYFSGDSIGYTGFNLANDYSISFDERSNYRLDFGAKLFFSRTDNSKTFSQRHQTVPEESFDQADAVTVDEQLYRPYVSAMMQFSDAWSLRAGLAIAHTRRSLDYSGDGSRVLSYTVVLPDFLLSYRTANHSATLTLSSSAKHPRFSQLNPFRWRVSWNSFYMGNPDLKCERNYNLTARYVYRNFLDFSARLYRTERALGRVTQAEGNILVDRPENAQNTTTLTICPTWYWTRLWWLQADVTPYYRYMRSTALVPNIPAKVSHHCWGGAFYASFFFNKERTLRASVGGSYQGAVKWTTVTQDPSVSFSASAQYFFNNRTMDVEAAGMSLFASHYKGIVTNGNYVMRFNNKFSYPSIYVTFRWRFSNIRDLTPRRQRTIRDVNSRL